MFANESHHCRFSINIMVKDITDVRQKNLKEFTALAVVLMI
jgi:hypothetical protein